MWNDFRLVWAFIAATALTAALGTVPGGSLPAAAEQDEAEPILGAPWAFDLGDQPLDRARLSAGAAIHEEPAGSSAILTRLDFAAELAILERRGGWRRVQWGTFHGWVLLDPSRDAELREVETAADAAPWIVLAGPDPAEVERALRHLGSEAGERQLGAYRLHTDVTDDRLLDDLSRLAERLPEVFRQRFGLAATPDNRETVVLYARAASYRSYAEGADDVTLLDSNGRAVSSLAVLHAEERLPGEVRSVLVQEIAHLLTYQALGANLPPWLAEGLAEDLAYCRVSRAGELLPGTLASWESSRTVPVIGPGGRIGMGVERRTGGPRPALQMLLAKWRDPRRPSLADLLVLSQREFMASERRSLHYAMSAFWVRYLMAAERADAFHAFLGEVARDEAVDAVRLRPRLGSSWDEIEASWGRWLRKAGPRDRGF